MSIHSLRGCPISHIRRRFRDAYPPEAIQLRRSNPASRVPVSTVMREVLLLTAAGLVIGVPAALALGRAVQSQLYGMKATDPAVLAASVAVDVTVSAVCAWMPARRAAKSIRSSRSGTNSRFPGNRAAAGA